MDVTQVVPESSEGELKMPSPTAQKQPKQRIAADEGLQADGDDSLLETTVDQTSEEEESVKESGLEDSENELEDSENDSSYDTIDYYSSDSEQEQVVGEADDEVEGEVSTERAPALRCVCGRENRVVPTCPMCAMLPQEHPRFVEVHNRVMLLLAELLGGGPFCLLVPSHTQSASQAPASQSQEPQGPQDEQGPQGKQQGPQGEQQGPQGEQQGPQGEEQSGNDRRYLSRIFNIIFANRLNGPNIDLDCEEERLVDSVHDIEE